MVSAQYRKPQSVIHRWSNIHPIFSMFDRLYTRVSQNSDDDSLVEFSLDSSFDDLCRILENYVYHFLTPKFENVKEPLDVKQSENKDIIVCFSSGKDSIATVLFYKKLGYNVHIYHLHGINKEYFDEFTAVIKLAELLDCDYFIDHCTLRGTHEFIEHPLKNMIIANGAIHYGIEHNLGTNIAFGNFADSFLADNQFEVCAGDCVEMWRAYEKVIQTIIPDFVIRTPLPNTSESLFMLESRPDLLENAMSCIQPYRFRAYRRQGIMDKYHVKLMNNRCGCCWKCCMEYIYYADHNILEYDEEYYRYCLSFLLRTVQRETGRAMDTIDELWTMYFFYDMYKSKAYERLKDATISTKQVKYRKQPAKR